ncbi:phosphotransferase [Azospirillum sp. ST 5-10]|uniref:phosphotransferase n=1 Tax=unclassified Azospirillum TaxID=2630922 RepID=UPI003F4A80AD
MKALYPTGETPFVQHKARLAGTKALPRLTRNAFTFRPSGLPAFNRRRILQLWLVGRRHPVHLPTTADAMQISEDGFRLRVFDLQRDRSYKVVVIDSRYGPGTENERRVRRDVLPGSGIRFPRIDTVIRRDGYLLMDEDLVRGRQWTICCDGDRFEQEIVEPLRRLARHYGVTRRPLDGMMPAAALRDADGALPLVAHLRRLVERNPLVAVSLCHGDLSVSNLAVDGGGAIFLDWEMAREDIVGSDLLLLARRFTRHRLVQDGARRMFADAHGDAFTFADGLACHLLGERAARAKPWERLSAEWAALVAGDAA